ncbi:hypothetical protein PISMIDRAFT_686742 [Pisolithus microcarpus 441]|uniref:Uncharacterized protein n=1 Tax=Pisolithus microcarpus 441 TaxID=765257 RepID=A0A0C9XUL4_9AGAM|nr:hypothetical protein PISMIDRAFT_686742 [Pisolithus microcarpus 441]
MARCFPYFEHGATVLCGRLQRSSLCTPSVDLIMARRFVSTCRIVGTLPVIGFLPLL